MQASLHGYELQKQKSEISINNDTETGQAIFWMSCDPGGKVAIRVDGIVAGIIRAYRPNGLAPDCGEDYFVTVEKIPGTYSYKATIAGNYNFLVKGTFTIEANKCTKIQIPIR